VEKRDVLIVANGEPVGREQELAAERVIIALDGAADYLRMVGIRPDVILGDFDSITDQEYWGIRALFSDLTGKESPYEGNRGILLVPTKDQNRSDLAKGIEYCDQEGAASILITNALGRRTDHLLANLRLLRRHHRPHRPLSITAAEEEINFIADDSFVIPATVGKKCAVMAFPEAYVTSHGLLYELQNHHLVLGEDSICNAVRREPAQLEVTGEALVIYGRP
jgi:thiamine pyrophosphokinase